MRSTIVRSGIVIPAEGGMGGQIYEGGEEGIGEDEGQPLSYIQYDCSRA